MDSSYGHVHSRQERRGSSRIFVSTGNRPDKTYSARSWFLLTASSVRAPSSLLFSYSSRAECCACLSAPPSCALRASVFFVLPGLQFWWCPPRTTSFAQIVQEFPPTGECDFMVTKTVLRKPSFRARRGMGKFPRVPGPRVNSTVVCEVILVRPKRPCSGHRSWNHIDEIRHLHASRRGIGARHPPWRR